MKFQEYQARNILERYGVAVPKGKETSDPKEAEKIAESLGGKSVVKAQVLMGGRGKAGGVKLFDDAKSAGEFTKELIGKKLKSIQNPDGLIVEQVLVSEQIDIAEEYYLSVLLDRAKQKNVVMISAKGGMDIEEVAENDPKAIVKLHVDPAWGLDDHEIRKAVSEAKIPKPAQMQMVKMIKALVKAYHEVDAEMVEINPVAWTPDGKLIAGDAKISIDDNALYKYPEYSNSVTDSISDPIESEASKRGIAYVRLDGDIAVIGNGAGLVMCSMDEISRAGGKAANFLDVGGGAQADKVKSCVELILMDKNAKGLLINIFGGITRCDEVAKGILHAFDDLEINIPVVARIEGTAAEEGMKLLKGSKLVPAATMQEAAKKIVQLSYA